jgi:hypothetical protein
MPESGLCRCAAHNLISYDLLDLFMPSEQELDELKNMHKSVGWWASDAYIWEFDKQKLYGFGPLRQNIILFMAAINNEL